MRTTALVAIARYPYKHFIDDLEELARTETDPDNKAEALRLAKSLRDYGKPAW